jgi:hypothetical protein
MLSDPKPVLYRKVRRKPVWADAVALEQLWGVGGHRRGDAGVEVVDLLGKAPDPVGQQPEGPGRGAGGVGGHTGVELRASADEDPAAQPRQRLAQRWVGDHQHGLELVDRLGAGLDRRILGELEHPGHLHRPVAGLCRRGRPTSKHRSGGGFGVDGVGLAASAPGGLVRLVDVEDLHAGGLQVAAQRRPVGAGALHPGPPRCPERLHPAEQLLVASGGGCKAAAVQQHTHGVEHRGHVGVLVGIDP